MVQGWRRWQKPVHAIIAPCSQAAKKLLAIDHAESMGFTLLRSDRPRCRVIAIKNIASSACCQSAGALKHARACSHYFCQCEWRENRANLGA
ncbi:hypothetical protein BV908_13110 [Diaphorobacter sp. LR2014-1]|nr:hypothetical protein BV908_13110 [Diaphorobacter sp. LR2014-1]